jgi:hypothetical protein
MKLSIGDKAARDKVTTSTTRLTFKAKRLSIGLPLSSCIVRLLGKKKVKDGQKQNRNRAETKVKRLSTHIRQNANIL